MKFITREFTTGELLFSIFILTYFIIIGFLTPGLKPLPRLFPAIIICFAIPTGILGVLTVVNQKIADLFSEAAINKKKIVKEKEDDLELGAQAAAIGWMLMYVVLFYLVGPLIALVIAPLIAMRYFGRMKWLTSLIVVALTWGVVYLIFVVLVESRLPAGLIFGRI